MVFLDLSISSWRPLCLGGLTAFPESKYDFTTREYARDRGERRDLNLGFFFAFLRALCGLERSGR
jgi:hypothetical protein